jgi:hypothetical protein
MPKYVKMFIAMEFEVDDESASTSDIEQCAIDGLIALRDNNVPIAHVENFETGGISEIRINDFTIIGMQRAKEHLEARLDEAVNKLFDELN